MERSLLGLGAATLVFVSATVGTACGSDAGSGTSTSSGSSSSGSSGTSGSSGSSGSEAVSPIVSGSNGSDGKPGELVSCTFDDSVDFDTINPPTMAVVAQPTGVALFMAGEEKVASTSPVRRYLLKSANPCVLERDKSYVGSDVAIGISVDAAQRVWGSLRLARLVPAPRIDCTGAKGIAGSVAIAPSGDFGFARLVDTDAKKENLAVFTTDGASCITTALAASPPPNTTWMEIAADHLGRAHVVSAERTTKKLSVRVFDKTGAEQGTYADSSKPYSTNVALTRCFEGTCLQDHERIVRYDAALKPVKEYVRTGDRLFTAIIAGDTTGPVFVGGVIDNSANDTTFRVVLSILASP